MLGTSTLGSATSIIAPGLLHTFHTPMAVAVYMIAGALLLRDRSREPLESDQDPGGVVRLATGTAAS